MSFSIPHPLPFDLGPHPIGFARRVGQRGDGRSFRVVPRRSAHHTGPAKGGALQSHVTRLLCEEALREAVPVAQGLSALRSGDLLVGCIDHLKPGVSLLGRDGRTLSARRGDLVLLCLADVDESADIANGHALGLKPRAWLDLIGENGMVSAHRLRDGGATVLGRIRGVGSLVDATGQTLRLPSIWQVASSARTIGTKMPELVLCGTRATTVTGVSRAITDVMTCLKSSGRRVGICRLNTTGRGTLPSDLIAAGAVAVVDLVDAGCSRLGTLSMSALERLCSKLFQDLAALGAELVLIEADGGLDQPEVSVLLMSQWFRSRLSAVLMKQESGEDIDPRCEWLESLGLQIRTDIHRCVRPA